MRSQKFAQKYLNESCMKFSHSAQMRLPLPLLAHFTSVDGLTAWLWLAAA